MLCSATGALFAQLWAWFVRMGKPDPGMAINGMLAGLVAITCPCAFVNAPGACIIGIVSGILVVEAVYFFDKLKIDDPVGAIAVHGVNGAWGCISLGLFGDGTYGGGWNGVGADKYMGKAGQGVTGLFYGDSSQLMAQIVGVVTCFITLSIISFIVFMIIEKTIGNRVSPEVEVEGLDIPEMGVFGYNGVKVDRASENIMSK